MARGISLNDEMIIAPRLRKDQREKIRTITKTNGKFPIVAEGLVRDFLKGNTNSKVLLDDDLTCLKVTVYDEAEKVATLYEFRFEDYVRLESPTLD
jgi:hypothetical protein